MSERLKAAAPGDVAISVPPVSSGIRPKRGGGALPRLLLVEGAPASVALVRRCLLESATPGVIVDVPGLEAARERIAADAFDLILLDLGLLNGDPALLSWVEDRPSGTPLLLLAGPDHRELGLRCLEAGAEDCLGKDTLTAEHLGRAVGYALARSQVRDLRNRLEHTDRLAAIGRLAVSVAHEINNPVTFITMNQALLLRRLDALRATAEAGDRGSFESLPGILAEMQEMLLENTLGIERISAIVRDLRTLARQDADEVLPVDPSGVCKAACAVVANHVRHHAELVTRFESVSKVLIDARKLEQVVINLVMNATQAIVRGTASENEVRVSTLERAGSVVIVVEDTGSGMAPRVRERIFEPFFSTKASAEGTGLGLSVSADIVTSFGGLITVDSEPGKGSRFEVVLPRATEEWARPVAAAATLPPRVRPRRRVLLVDDDPQVLAALRRSLAAVHDVATAPGGKAALELLERDSAFDAVLCDLTMPDVDGVAVHRVIESRFPHLLPRFLAVTGGTITDRTAEFAEADGARVLTKPVSPERLLKAIDQITRG